MRLTCEDSALQPHRNSEQLNLLDIECIQIVTMIVRYVLAGRGALVAYAGSGNSAPEELDWRSGARRRNQKLHSAEAGITLQIW
jgi:hypothetical protein